MTNNAPLTFPKGWPAECPPVDAADAEGDIYRVVKSTPPTDGDFLSQAQLNQAVGADECRRCGLSVLRTLRDAEHCRDLNPHLGGFIALAAARPEHGKLKQTGGKKFHHTFWAYHSAQLVALFRGVDGDA